MLQFLTIVLNNFCNSNGLPIQSADDLLNNYSITLSTYQKQWLTEYGKVWEVVVNVAD